MTNSSTDSRDTCLYLVLSIKIYLLRTHPLMPKHPFPGRDRRSEALDQFAPQTQTIRSSFMPQPDWVFLGSDGPWEKERPLASTRLNSWSLLGFC